MIRALQLIPFPALRPIHGGQLRAHYTGQILEKIGFDVHRVAVYDSKIYPCAEREPFIDLSGIPFQRHPLATALYTPELVRAAPDRLVRFAQLVEAARPELVVLDHPWLWPLLSDSGSSAAQAPLLYNSYNIEAPLLHSNLTAFGATAEEADILAEEAARIERFVVCAADGCAACTDADAAGLYAMGARKVVVAPNGTVARQRDHLKGALPDGIASDIRFVFCIGSAHPPNLVGLTDILSTVLPSLRPDEAIVVAGGASELLRQWLGHPGSPRNLARGRLILLGQVSQLALDALYANAAGVILPIAFGGGSNIKTAEAIWSGLPIIGTRTAFRSFERFIDDSYLFVADTAEEFSRAIRYVLTTALPRKPRAGADELLWQNTLRPLAELAMRIVAETSAPQDSPQSSQGSRQPPTG